MHDHWVSERSLTAKHLLYSVLTAWLNTCSSMWRLYLSFKSENAFFSTTSLLFGARKQNVPPSAILATEWELGASSFSKMATTAEICPSVETLTNFETAVPCPAQGCTKVFPSTSSLRMHVVKTHNMATCIEEKQVFVRGATKAQVSKHFYCPVEFCPRGKDSKRPFPRLGQLKQVKAIDRLRQTDTDR